MTKPLTIFLELVGFLLLMFGISGGNAFLITLGALSIILGAIGIRQRLNQERRAIDKVKDQIARFSGKP